MSVINLLIQPSLWPITCTVACYTASKQGEAVGDDLDGGTVAYRRVLADLQKLPDPCRGKECFALTEKQVLSTGALLWDASISERDVEMNDQIQGNELTPQETSTMLKEHTFHLRAWVFGSDQGPDQVGADSYFDAAVSSCVFVLKFRQWCFQHMLHLITGRQLKALKSYFSNVAKVIHCIRNHWKDVYKAWASLFNAEEAKRFLSKLPQRPLRGRWGTMFAAEVDLLRMGLSKLRDVFEKAFPSKAEKKKRKRGREEDRGDRDILDEEHESFTEKGQRWKTEAKQALNDPDFPYMVHCAHESRRPAEIARRTFQKRALKHHEHLEKLNSGEVRPENRDDKPPIVRFVCQDTQKIAKLFDELFKDEQLRSSWGPLLDIEDEEERSRWFGEAIEMCLGVAVDYFRRLLHTVRVFPYLLFWIVWHPPLYKDDTRKDLARDLLSLDQERMPWVPETVFKIVRIFWHEFTAMEELL